MYVSVRRYDGVTQSQEAAKLVQQGFVPLISKMPGFVEYYWVDLGSGVMMSVSTFDTMQHAMESSHVAADWVRKNLGSILPNSPRIESGKVVAHKSMAKMNW
jgi:hypothetical protein